MIRIAVAALATVLAFPTAAAALPWRSGYVPADPLASKQYYLGQDHAFDAFGADLNAATSKEATVLHAHFLDEHLDRAFQVMGDMLLRTTYADLDSEREVVLDEIAMY